MTKRLFFDRLMDGLEQIPKLPEAATKAPPVGRAAPCQSNDWLGSLNRRIKIKSHGNIEDDPARASPDKP